MENQMIVKCPNGHYYDKNETDHCPYCENTENSGNSIALGFDPPKTGGGGSTIPIGHVDETIPLGERIHINNQKTSKGTIPMNAGGGTRPVNVSPTRTSGDTVSISERELGFDPVVGWLVCINGFNKGRSFTIHSDRNLIGRGEGNDICIQGDQAISYSHDSSIVYDRKSKIFMFVPGDGRAVSYVNDEAALVPIKLKLYDKITIGDTDLMFVPFCGKEFDWK